MDRWLRLIANLVAARVASWRLLKMHHGAGGVLRPSRYKTARCCCIGSPHHDPRRPYHCKTEAEDARLPPPPSPILPPPAPVNEDQLRWRRGSSPRKCHLPTTKNLEWCISIFNDCSWLSSP
ncbi:uncharacterized protein LOC123515596 isoform X2 [Portunus trituberculatus]|uniref:uncharacterized protein LOC123515596 isoform X2 n=1 Tax=Portunus trituberculatus TaxID=210409 RepID=UPI001E1CF9CA|nr:uncharacterized protein LOC123515596 isoform X2 [Portunus trituberculatus]